MHFLFIEYFFNILDETLVSSAAIKSTEDSMSIALKLKSPKLPIGEPTTYKMPGFADVVRIDAECAVKPSGCCFLTFETLHAPESTRARFSQR